MYSVGLPNRSISKGKCVIVIWSINYKKRFLSNSHSYYLFPTHLIGCPFNELVRRSENFIHVKRVVFCVCSAKPGTVGCVYVCIYIYQHIYACNDN